MMPVDNSHPVLLMVYVVSLCGLAIGVVSAYAKARKGQRSALAYVPGSWLLILGLLLNIARLLSLLPQPISRIAFLVAAVMIIIGFVLIERQWRKDKQRRMG